MFVLKSARTNQTALPPLPAALPLRGKSLLIAHPTVAKAGTPPQPERRTQIGSVLRKVSV